MIDAAQPEAVGKALTGREMGETWRVAAGPSKPTTHAGEVPASREELFTGLARQLWPWGADAGVAPVSQIATVAGENGNELEPFSSIAGPVGSPVSESRFVGAAVG